MECPPNKDNVRIGSPERAPSIIEITRLDGANRHPAGTVALQDGVVVFSQVPEDLKRHLEVCGVQGRSGTTYFPEQGSSFLRALAECRFLGQTFEFVVSSF